MYMTYVMRNKKNIVVVVVVVVVVITKHNKLLKIYDNSL